MANPVLLLADSSSNLLAARNQMGFTLGFHIVLACLGVAFPAMMLIAEWRGRRRNDEAALRLARNWSKAVAVLFAVGAVTGTVLSFEFGLLWPRFMDRFGDAFGIAFAIEGIFFFLEAIFIAIYIYGWDRLSPRAHMWAAVPIVISGVGGAFSVIAANAWMNQPQGFKLDASGHVTDVKPFEVLFNNATGYEFFHMLLAAYMVTGFILASIYAVGMLRGRRDRYHRLGLLIPLTVAAIATPIQLFVGDTAARAVADDQPAKFAGMECIYHGGPDQTEYLGGRCVDGKVKGGIGIPGLDSFLVGFSKNTDVTGLNQIPANEQPPALTMLHLSFDTMVGIGTSSSCSPSGSRSPGGESGTCRRRSGSCGRSRSRASPPSSPSSPAGSSPRWVASPGSSRGSCGPPRRSLRRKGIWWVFAFTMLLYVALFTTAALILRALARRWREGQERRVSSPTARRPAGAPREPRHEHRGRLRRDPLGRRHALRDLRRRGLRRRRLGPPRRRRRAGTTGCAGRSIARSGPVWEANHVWLIFVLVVLWTAFPTAFSAIMTTVYIPLALAALGIVLRGSGFAFRHALPGPVQRPASRVFGFASRAHAVLHGDGRRGDRLRRGARGGGR